MLQGIKKTDLDPERVMEGRITDNVDIESVKVSGPGFGFQHLGNLTGR